MPVIGYLSPTSFGVSFGTLRDFIRGLKEVGYIIGENVAIDTAGPKVNTINCQQWLPSRSASRSIGIVAVPTLRRFAAKARPRRSPLSSCLPKIRSSLNSSASLSRPGGNATGINFVSGELTAKWLELLHELVPAAARVAVLVNPADATATATVSRDLRTVCAPPV